VEQKERKQKERKQKVSHAPSLDMVCRVHSAALPAVRHIAHMHVVQGGGDAVGNVAGLPARQGLA
jgi:hypothetical protein